MGTFCKKGAFLGKMANETLTKLGTVKQAYSVLEEVMQEVVLSEEAALQAICNRLKEENSKAKSPAIAKIIGVLQDWGKVSAEELKERALHI